MATERGGYDLQDRDMLSVGHVNVFQPLVRADLEAGEHIRDIDITSHYLNICAHLPLCSDHPTRLLGPEIDRPRLDPKHPVRMTVRVVNRAVKPARGGVRS
jgi:hypothetical protein